MRSPPNFPFHHENCPPTPFSSFAVNQLVNTSDYTALSSSLNNAVSILEHHRRSDPGFIAALDTLKQARAMIEKSIKEPQTAPARVELEVAA